MAWDWDYRVGGVALDAYCESVRIPDTSAGRRGSNFAVPFNDGESWRPKPAAAGYIMLDTVLRYAAGGDTEHPDGDAGSVYANLSALKALLLRSGALVNLRRHTPHLGVVSIDVEATEPISVGDTRHRFLWPLTVPYPYWLAAGDPSTASGTYTGTSVTLTPTVGGDTEADPIATITCNSGTLTNPRITHGNRWIQYSGSLGSGDVLVVDVRARTAILNGTVPVDAALAKRTPDWLRLPGATSPALAITRAASGSPNYTVAVAWRDTWRL